MTNDQGQRRVILIFGEPGHGKSSLAKYLQDKHGYHPIGLDEVYVEFVRTKYSNVFLPDLRGVIAQHFNFIFSQIAAGKETWADEVVSVVEKALQEHPRVAVEGYLLSHALDTVQQRLAGKAVLTTVEARHRQYFVASSVEQIVKSNR